VLNVSSALVVIIIVYKSLIVTFAILSLIPAPIYSRNTRNTEAILEASIEEEKSGWRFDVYSRRKKSFLVCVLCKKLLAALQSIAWVVRLVGICLANKAVLIDI